MIFSELLKKHRKLNKLTQTELVERLIEYDDSFITLDVSTLSRWERKITHPTMAKKILILRSLNVDLQEIFKYYSLDGEDKDAIPKALSRTHDPYYFGVDKVCEREVIRSSCDYNKIKRFNENFLKLNSKFKNGFNVEGYYTSNHELVGHIMYSFFSYDDLSDIDLFNIDDLCCPDALRLGNEKCLFNVMSIYSSVPSARILLAIDVLDVIIKNPSVRLLLLTLAYQEPFDFLKKYANIINIEFGEESVLSGIKHLGKQYSHARLLISTEDLLSVPLLNDLIVNREGYKKRNIQF